MIIVETAPVYYPFSDSVVLSSYFEEALRMSAYRADLRSLCSDYDMSAVAAFPDLDFALLENSCSLNVVEESSVSLLMLLLDCCNEPELDGQILESFFLSCLGKAFVHICPLEVLAVSSCREVSLCIADALKFLEPHLSVLFLIICSMEEDGCDLLETFLLCYGCKICILVPCLGLAEYLLINVTSRQIKYINYNNMLSVKQVFQSWTVMISMTWGSRGLS